MALTDLSALLRGLSPKVLDGQFVFAATDLDLRAQARIVEQEGPTLVLEREVADAAGVAYEGCWAWITLEVRSALEAVGLTAAVSAALTQAAIPCNVIAGFHHDHLLVPIARVDDALESLDALRSSVVG